jgi:hypothetical protein
MTTLFTISAAAFALAAIAWFSTWAFWIHPPEGWLGKATVEVMPLAENNEVRHARWFLCLRIVTVLLGATTLVLLAALVRAHQLGV